MKQHTGAEIHAIMAAMPDDQVAALVAAHPEHHITEREARWWGYLMFARIEAYEGETYVIKVMTGEAASHRFLSYVLEGRAGDDRHGIVRRPWPDGGIDLVGKRA